ncbi:hypothetical protein A3L12_08095 [Thermococcus sp. P6]|uniref:hypothetical protein n=1 Tax=Thermococcus sp. P6 TaxID=122420 RepID=UPI000B5A0021|nr:hypothetical protein [Thermococcus sp. P6]ASJ11257.1 hypothetical protein A3L12_08095 [Thermococcus sp. P6]
MKRFTLFFLLGLFLFTVGPFFVPHQQEMNSTASGFLSGNGSSTSIFVSTARRVAVSVVTDNSGRYGILIFDGTRGRFIANLTAMGNMYREVELPDSGTYYFVYRGNGTARIAIRTISAYPSERVLRTEYVSGGTVAFLLAVLIWPGVRK